MQIINKVYPTAPLHSEGPFFNHNYDIQVGIISEYNQPILNLYHIVLNDMDDDDKHLGLYCDSSPSLSGPQDYFEKPKLNKLYKFLELDYYWVSYLGDAPVLVIGSDSSNGVLDKLHEIIEFDENDPDTIDISNQINQMIGSDINICLSDDDGIVFEPIEDLNLSQEGIKSLNDIRNTIKIARAQLSPKEDKNLDGVNCSLENINDGDAIILYVGEDDCFIYRLAQPNFL